MKKLLIILLSIISLQLNAGIKYVAASGGDNGNAGTQAEPWATIAYGVANVSSGDTVYILAGTHTVDTRITVPVGVSIMGAGATSIISSTVSTTYYTALYLHSATQGTNGNQTISYIKMDGNSETGWGAIQINCRSNVKVHHCTFVDFFSTAVIFNAAASYISTPPATFAIGNEFHHCQVDNCSDYPESVDNGQGAVMIGGQDGMKIYDNVINQTTRDPVKRNGYCIKFYSNGYNKGFEIYNNTLNRAITTQSYPYYDFSIETWHTLGGAHIYNNTMTGGIDFAGGSYTCLIKGDYDYGAWVHDNTIGPASYMGSETTGLYLERNSEWAIIERNTFKNFYNGIMFSPSSGETTNNHDIRYNIFNQCQYYGIRFINGTSGAYADSINIYNNIFYCASATSTLVGIGLLSVGTTTNLNVINNIIQGYDYAPMFANGTSGQTMDKINISNNLMYGNANGNEPLFSSLTPTNYTYANNVINDNPDFTTPGSDFTLQSVSPGKDAGLDVGLTTDILEYAVPYNLVVDIGAYEYGSSPVEEPVLVTSITVSGAGGTSTISTDGGTLQLTTSVLPEDATDKTVTWSKTDGTGSAIISSGGLVTAVADGTVTATATANDGSDVYDDFEITISNQEVSSKPILQEIEIGNIATNFIILTYDINLDESSTPVTSDFSLSGTVRFITGILVYGKAVRLGLNLPVSYGNVIYVTYTGTAIKSTEGISADTFESQLVINNLYSDLRAITSFSFLQQVSPAVINNSLYTVAIEVSEEANITALTPTITVSDGATINPLSGVQRDFTNPVTYTVTAANWSTRNWTVTVTGGMTPSTGGFKKSGSKLLKHNETFIK